ncbi:MAG: hypothetical protein AAB683_01010, partial [Patescibacteria group bacterium]
TTLAVSAPTVTTQAASSVDATTAVLNGNITSNGYNGITQHGFAYGTSATLATTISTSTLGTANTGAYTQSISSLSAETTYYSRAYSTNSAGTSYGTIVSFTTSALGLQTLTTVAASSITTTGAVLNASITDTGGSNATATGFVYSTESDFISPIATTTEGAFSGTGSISSSVTSLTCASTYYFRPYTTNSAGTAYGSSLNFSTSACASSAPVSSDSTNSTSGGRGIVGNIVYNTGNVIKDFISNTPVTTDVSEQILANKKDDSHNSWDLISVVDIDEDDVKISNKLLTEIKTKFPNLINLFTKLGVSNISDIEKLNGVEIPLPILEDKKDLPAEIISVDSKSLEIPTTISISDTGTVEQKIETTSNKELSLSVKPIGPVHSIVGYLTFKSRNENTNTSINNIKVAYADEISDEKFLIEKFNYEDTDGDGIYTAVIKTPLIEGVYEIITIVDYVNKKLGKRELKMITVVDPEGYVYETIQGREARVKNIEVAI